MREHPTTDLCMEIHLHGTYSRKGEVYSRTIQAESRVIIPRSEWDKRLKDFGIEVVPVELSKEIADILNSLLEYVQKKKSTIKTTEDLIEFMYSKREKLFE